MVCSVCGTDNEKGFKFCVKCGSNIENPSEVNYEQVDMGNYHTEEEFSDDRNGFTMDTGTFVIRDTAPQPAQTNLYTADELNRSEEEFDFSMYDDPSMASLPPTPAPPPQPQNQQVYQQPQQVYGQPMQGYMQQPMMYQQPQIIGYDPTGMPIYGQQPMMYQQPQIIGYDPTGMPIYGQQPMMYQQPQIIGYDPTGMPIYGQQPMPPPTGQMMNGMAAAPNQQMMNGMMYGMPEPTAPPPPAPPQPKQEEAPKKEEKNDFWAFFDGGQKEDHHDTTEDDFFGKAKNEPVIPEDPFADIDNRRKKRLQEAMPSTMSDTPIVDPSLLQRNDPGNLNRMYMEQMGDTASGDLSFGSMYKKRRVMAETEAVDADMLEENVRMRSKITMQHAGEANANDIRAYVPEHREAIMAQADRAVEAMPKRVNPYESELDRIELPEYMQARKRSREEAFEIPSIPDVGNKR